MEALRDAQLERLIDQRTNGRVHRLEVETVGDRFVVRGCTSTHYARQLALAAVLDAVKSGEVVLDICVCMGSRPLHATRSALNAPSVAETYDTNGDGLESVFEVDRAALAVS